MSTKQKQVIRRRSAAKASVISWTVSAEDSRLIHAIVARVCAKFPDESRLPLTMDLTATHANGMPMDFDKLLAADNFNFWHDVRGIQRHLDRRTGKLTDCFVPRFAR